MEVQRLKTKRSPLQALWDRIAGAFGKSREPTDDEIRSRVYLNEEQRRELIERVKTDPELARKREATLAAHPEFRRKGAGGGDIPDRTER